MSKLAKYVFILLCLVLHTESASAVMVKASSYGIVHESPNSNFIDTFVEDVIFLLPKKFSQVMTDNIKTVSTGAKFQLPNNSWQHPIVLTEPELKQKLYGISSRFKKKGSKETLARDLGTSIKDILLVAMRSTNYDPTNETIKNNLNDFKKNGTTRAYKIRFDGYHSHSFDSNVKSLYGLSQYDKGQIYPELVILTAKIWTSIWMASGESDSYTKQFFVRRPITANTNGTSPLTDSSGRITKVRDVTEAAIVLENYDKSSSTIEKELLKNRIAANIMNRTSTLSGDVTIVFTDNLAVARSRQDAYAKYDVFPILSPVGDSESDSLERFVQELKQ